MQQDDCGAVSQHPIDDFGIAALNVPEEDGLHVCD
jgi:hypothetical protein